MIKKLAVPALVLVMAGFGCSSSTTSTTGTGGSAGHASGGSAVAGTSGGGQAGGGTSGGGTSGGGQAGGGSSGGGTSGGGHAGGGSSGGGHAGGGSSGGGAGGHAGSAGTSGGGTSGGGTSGGGAGGVQVMANCNVTMQDGTSVLSAQVFCDNLLANCTPTASYMDSATCKATYGAITSVAKQNCQSYHLCWGVEGKTNTQTPNGDPATHCPHAQGAGPCAGL